MSSLEVPGDGEISPASQEDPRRKRASEIIASELQLCRRLGMDPSHFDVLEGIRHALYTHMLIRSNERVEEVFPGLLEEALQPPEEGEPRADVIPIKRTQTTIPPPKHSPAA